MPTIQPVHAMAGWDHNTTAKNLLLSEDQMSLMGMPALVLGNYQYDVHVHKCSLCVMVENENLILHSSNVSKFSQFLV